MCILVKCLESVIEKSQPGDFSREEEGDALKSRTNDERVMSDYCTERFASGEYNLLRKLKSDVEREHYARAMK